LEQRQSGGVEEAGGEEREERDGAPQSVGERANDEPRDRSQFIGLADRHACQAGKHQYANSDRESFHGRFSFKELHTLTSYSRFESICVTSQL